jgi:sulfite exporter TauE/SafE
VAAPEPVLISALIGAFLAGALGGVHCVAMCGGFVTAFSGSGTAARPLLPARALVEA